MPLRPLKPAPKKLPPILGAVTEEPQDWQSPGVSLKPDNCGACKYQSTGSGFCADDSPDGRRMAILCAAPTKGEILEQRCWRGSQGWLYTQMFLDSAGIPRNEVQIGHVLRCRPPFKRSSAGVDCYPTSTQRRNAELTCRSYDKCHSDRGHIQAGGIKDFAPDTFLVTFEPEKALEITAYKRIIQEDIKKAWRLVEKGRRVMVLMGEPPFTLLGDGLSAEGGVKNFRGHYWSATWPFGDIVVPKVAFAPPKNRYRRYR